MGISENLFSNLLVTFILITLGLVIYCKVSGKSLIDLIKEIKEATTEYE